MCKVQRKALARLDAQSDHNMIFAPGNNPSEVRNRASGWLWLQETMALSPVQREALTGLAAQHDDVVHFDPGKAIGTELKASQCPQDTMDSQAERSGWAYKPGRQK